MGFSSKHSAWTSANDSWGWQLSPLPAVRWLLITNTATFFLKEILELFGFNFFSTLFQLSAAGIQQGYFWQLVTYMFLHASVLHLFLNLFMLYFFGNEVEATFGSKRFLKLYFVGGVVGGFLWLAFNFHRPHFIVVGASGAIYAVVTAFATLYPNRPITLLLFFILPITILAKYLAFSMLAISVLYSIHQEGNDVAHLAHLGGIIVGYLFVKISESSFSFPKWKDFKQHLFTRSPRSSPKILKSPLGKEEFIQKQIDPILDKIAKCGIQSLTPEERRLLEEAKDRLS